MARQPKAPAVPAPTFIQSENYQSIYSNNTQLQMSAFDVRLIFGEAATVSGESQQIEQKVAVVLSLHHAKVFSQVLAKNITEYERQIGELKFPANAATPPATGETE